MKTKIVLLVTVLAAALLVGGCASVSTPQTHHIKNVMEKDGVYHLKDTNKPITGRIVEMVGGHLHLDFLVKDGVKDGHYRRWWKRILRILTQMQFIKMENWFG